MYEVLDAVSGDLSDKVTREALMAFEQANAELPQIEIPVKHHWAGGIYAREIIIPAGVQLTGAIYLEDHFDVMVYGHVIVSSEDGRKELQGFQFFKGNQGKKRAGITLAETRWITFCSSPELPDCMYLDHLTTTDFNALDEYVAVPEDEIKQAFRSQATFRKGEYDAFRRGYLLGRGHG